MQYLWLLYFINCNFYGYGIFMVIFTTLVTYIYTKLYVVKQIQVLRLLKRMSVKFLSMTFILLGFGKAGFCEMFAKRGTLQKSGREVLTEEIFENKNIIFHINYATH